MERRYGMPCRGEKCVRSTTLCAKPAMLRSARDGGTISMATIGKEVRLWDTETGELLGSFPGHLTSITCAAFTPDGGTLVSGSNDGTVLFWDLSDFSERGRVR